MIKTTRPFLVLLTPGPVYRQASYEKSLLAALSSVASGELWTTGPDRLRTNVGSFRLVCSSFLYHVPVLGHLLHALRLMARAVGLRLRPKRDTIVWSYDPFRDGIIGLVMARIIGCRLVVEVNGSFGNPALNAGTVQSVGANLRRGLMLRLGAFVLHRADGIRTLFEGQLDCFRLQSRTSIVRQFPCFVCIQGATQRPEEFYILFAGFPYYAKGVDILLRAFAEVKNSCAEWTLVLVGHGIPEAVKDACMPLDRVVLYPGIWHEELLDLMSRCSIFVLPSRSEAMGRVLVEAAACGKPRIASRVEGTPTVVRDGIDGILVPVDDASALADAMIRLIRDERLRSELGRNGQRRIAEDLGVDAFLRNMSCLIQAVLARTNVGS